MTSSDTVLAAAARAIQGSGVRIAASRLAIEQGNRLVLQSGTRRD